MKWFDSKFMYAILALIVIGSFMFGFLADKLIGPDCPDAPVDTEGDKIDCAIRLISQQRSIDSLIETNDWIWQLIAVMVEDKYPVRFIGCDEETGQLLFVSEPNPCSGSEDSIAVLNKLLGNAVLSLRMWSPTPLSDPPVPVGWTTGDQTEALRLVSEIRAETHKLIDSIAVLNERLDWLAWLRYECIDNADSIPVIYRASVLWIDEFGRPCAPPLPDPCSGMVSVAAVEGCVDPVTNTWGGASMVTDPDYEEWSVTDTLYFIFDYNRWDSLKARGL